MGRKPYDFLSRYEVLETGCWKYLGPLDAKGYGSAGSKGRAHRYFYSVMVMPIPQGLTIDHLCRFTSCVNPSHMEVVTNEENTRRARADKHNRTHCPAGHPLDADNTYFYPSGARECRICRRAYVQKHRAKYGRTRVPRVAEDAR